MSDKDKIIKALQEVRKLLYVRRVVYMSESVKYVDSWSSKVGVRSWMGLNAGELLLESLLEATTLARKSINNSAVVIREAYETLPAGAGPLKRIFGDAMSAAEDMVKSLDMEIEKRNDEISARADEINRTITSLGKVNALDKTIKLVESIIGVKDDIITSDGQPSAINDIITQWESKESISLDYHIDTDELDGVLNTK